MDPLICCVLGICCPPFSAEQREAFETLITQHVGDAETAKRIADATFDDFAKATVRLSQLVKA